jgi:DNA-binding SARP family transcriptional activator
MAVLEFRFLGDFAVLRDGKPMPLPPSKKTRALLAYLCLQPRRFQRGQLCELLWEVPDDPRGSLRWSLTKLRRLVDDDDRPRIVADRASVGIDAAGIAIDVRGLRAAARDPLGGVATAALQDSVARYRGNFLEGLEFSSFHSFHTWYVGEQEQALSDRACLLTELVARLAGEPHLALPHARALVGLFPYHEGHRATLIRLLNDARQLPEAEEQYQLGLRMLKEVGATSTGALMAARRPPRIDSPPKPAPIARAPVAATAHRSAARQLVGREVEMAWVAAAIADTLDQGRASMGLLRGAPGIGKSSVLEAARSMASDQGALVLHASAFESDAMRPFSLWTDALRAQEPAMHDAVFGGADPSNRDRLFARLGEAIAGRLAAGPVVLIVDDVQWCDESSAAALLYVTRMNKGRPLLGLLAARDGEVRDNVPLQQALRGLRRDGLLREIELSPLSPEALVLLIDQHAPGTDSRRLSVDCAGNPLLAIELALAERAGDTGESLDELVRDRLARFGAVGGEVMRWAAVLSARIDVGMLVNASGLDATAVGEAFGHAERHGMLRSTPQGLRFAHDLIARAIYTEISPLRRQVMHRRIAELLEQDTAQDLARAADLAHHATLSADAGLAARAMVSAGRLSLRFFANDEALSLARRGLQLAENLRDAERVQVEIDLHDVLLAAGPVDDWDAAAHRYTVLAERALDHGALAHARLGYHMAAYSRWTLGHWSAAREQTLQATRAVRGGREEAQIVGMAETAKCLVMIERDISQADAMLMEARALAERKGFRHHAIAAGLGMLRFHEDRLDEANESFIEARTLCKSAGDRVAEYQANEYLVMVDLQRGRLQEARERSRDLLVLGDKLRQGSEEPFARAMVALCDYAIDDRADGLDAALADLRIADAKHRLAYILTRAALLDCERGRFEIASGRATEALGYATLLERATEMLLANAVLARDRTVAGDARGATGYTAEVDRLADAGAALWTRAVTARLAGQAALHGVTELPTLTASPTLTMSPTLTESP